MSRDTCRNIGCDSPTRDRGDLQYPDDPSKTASNGKRFRVSAFGARFCSTRCELQYEHARDDARGAREREQRDEPHPEEA